MRLLRRHDDAFPLRARVKYCWGWTTRSSQLRKAPFPQAGDNSHSIQLGKNAPKHSEKQQETEPRRHIVSIAWCDCHVNVFLPIEIVPWGPTLKWALMELYAVKHRTCTCTSALWLLRPHSLVSRGYVNTCRARWFYGAKCSYHIRVFEFRLLQIWFLNRWFVQWHFDVGFIGERYNLRFSHCAVPRKNTLECLLTWRVCVSSSLGTDLKN